MTRRPNQAPMGDFPKGKAQAEISALIPEDFGSLMESHSLPPVKNSLDYNIDDPEKPTSIYLFREDYCADNQVSILGTFRGKCTVKFNSFVAVGNSFEPPTLQMFNEAQIHGPIGKRDLQIKLKPGRVSAQLDLGHHQLEETVGGQRTTPSFLNPYLFFEADRELQKRLAGVGCLITRGNFYKNNFRLNLRHGQRAVDWDIGSNVTLKHKGFFFSSLLNFCLKGGLQFNSRRFTLGYDRNSFNVNAEVGFGRGSLRDWRPEFGTFSLAYDLREFGVFGLLYSAGESRRMKNGCALIGARGVRSFNGLEQFPVNSITSLSDLKTHIKDNFAFAFRKTLNDRTEIKTKFSVKGPNAFFLSYRLHENVSIQTTVQTLVASEQNLGFLDLPFEFGLKLKIES